jgi:peptidyl-prolyl cis-trans isomerase D
MISWIQNHLIRHGRWIFLTLLGVVIVAFVFTIGNTPGCTSNRSAYEVASFYGYDLNSPKQMESLSRKVGLSAQLSNANIQNDQQFQSQLTGRIALLHLADQIGIPAPSPAALSEFIHSQPLFADEDGNFSRDAMTRFIDSVESNPSIPSGTVVAGPPGRLSHRSGCRSALRTGLLIAKRSTRAGAAQSNQLHGVDRTARLPRIYPGNR